VQLIGHELGQRPPGSVSPLSLEGEQMLLYYLVKGSLFRLPPDIGWAGWLRLDEGSCLHIQVLSASRPRKLPATSAATSPRLRVPACRTKKRQWVIALTAIAVGWPWWLSGRRQLRARTPRRF
jgi:hypothetical protein